MTVMAESVRRQALSLAGTSAAGINGRPSRLQVSSLRVALFASAKDRLSSWHLNPAVSSPLKRATYRPGQACDRGPLTPN
jgi:hypothetical protein